MSTFTVVLGFNMIDRFFCMQTDAPSDWPGQASGQSAASQLALHNLLLAPKPSGRWSCQTLNVLSIMDIWVCFLMNLHIKARLCTI